MAGDPLNPALPPSNANATLGIKAGPVQVGKKQKGSVQGSQRPPTEAQVIMASYEWDKQPVKQKKTKAIVNPMDKTSQVYVSANETLSPSASAGDWIHDFVHSKNSKFEGKSKKERIKMALGAFYHKEQIAEGAEEHAKHADHSQNPFHKTLTAHGFVHAHTEHKSNHLTSDKTGQHDYTQHVYTHPHHGKSHVTIWQYHHPDKGHGGKHVPHVFFHRHEQSNGIMAPESGENKNHLHRSLSYHYGVPKGMDAPKQTAHEKRMPAHLQHHYKMNEGLTGATRMQIQTTYNNSAKTHPTVAARIAHVEKAHNIRNLRVNGMHQVVHYRHHGEQDERDEPTRPTMTKLQDEFIPEARIGKPLKGHPYHEKSDAELHYITRDAGAASHHHDSMHGSSVYNKYADQVNDAATILHYRRKGGKRVELKGFRDAAVTGKARDFANESVAEDIHNPNSSGQGHDPEHASHPLHATISKHGYNYSHSTPIGRADGTKYISHTYKHSGHNVSTHSDAHHTGMQIWSTSTSTSSGHHHQGAGETELEHHLKDKGRRYGLKKNRPVHEVVTTLEDLKPIFEARYSKDAVDKAIASSNRHGPKIGKKEATLIHRLLKGRHGHVTSPPQHKPSAESMLMQPGFLFKKQAESVEVNEISKKVLRSYLAKTAGGDFVNPANVKALHGDLKAGRRGQGFTTQRRLGMAQAAKRLKEDNFHMTHNYADWHETAEKRGHGEDGDMVHFKIKNAGGRTEAWHKGRKIGHFDHGKKMGSLHESPESEVRRQEAIKGHAPAPKPHEELLKLKHSDPAEYSRQMNQKGKEGGDLRAEMTESHPHESFPNAHFVHGRDIHGSRVYYTGKAGHEFVSPHGEHAFRYDTHLQAHERAKMLNRSTAVHGVHFTTLSPGLKEETITEEKHPKQVGDRVKVSVAHVSSPGGGVEHVDHGTGTVTHIHHGVNKRYEVKMDKHGITKEYGWQHVSHHIKEEVVTEGKKTKSSEKMSRKYLGARRGTTATGQKAHEVIIDPIIKADPKAGVNAANRKQALPAPDKGI